MGIEHQNFPSQRRSGEEAPPFEKVHMTLTQADLFFGAPTSLERYTKTIGKYRELIAIAQPLRLIGTHPLVPEIGSEFAPEVFEVSAIAGDGQACVPLGNGLCGKHNIVLSVASDQHLGLGAECQIGFAGVGLEGMTLNQFELNAVGMLDQMTENVSDPRRPFLLCGANAAHPVPERSFFMGEAFEIREPVEHGTRLEYTLHVAGRRSPLPLASGLRTST